MPPALTFGDAGDGGYFDVAEVDATQARVDGGFEAPDGSVVREDRFVTKVVSFTPGECAGFGASSMPTVVTGPPIGSGALAGSLDVVSLGVGGEIVLSFEPNAIVDGAGTDFLVFENAFNIGGNPQNPLAEPAEIAVSDDGATWHTFACTPTAPFAGCAGKSPVISAPGNGVSPIDPAVAGGDAFDLAAVGLTRARFVRVRDVSTGPCGGTPKPNTAGFDLDAIAIVNAETP